jgi:hypothetical protein
MPFLSLEGNVLPVALVIARIILNKAFVFVYSEIN